MSTIFIIYMLTLLFSLFLAGLFLFLLVRKLVLLYVESRDKSYEDHIFPKLCRFVTQEDNQQQRLFRHAKSWQRRIVLRLLVDIAANAKDQSEWEQIRAVCEQIELGKRLAASLQDKRWWKVAEAIRYVGILRLDEFASIVAKHLDAEEYDVWTAAARTLTRLGRNEVLIQYLIDHHEKLKREAVIRIVDMLRNITDSDVEKMMAHFEQVPPLLQGLFFDLFGQAKAIKALPVLEEYLTSADGEHRVKAMKAIADIGITSKQDEVLTGFQSQNWVERMQTIRIVRACSMHIAIPHLVDALADPEWWVRYHAAETLHSFGTIGKERLREARLHHQDSYARDMAAQILSRWSA
ncbi:HEAT repeat domain-containing protein [Brevibacillus migulae]|uniref:HEAT repeat domain-containing protein n=1 Tax=Brevibacillus migulae TaxID=1644114 RepID=UPI00106E403D|nr:HEAT repeat domain-containing protein [Brevibacillus migulae]